MTRRPALRFTGWITLLVFALALLAPAVWRTLSSGPAGAAAPDGWVQVCTPSGMAWLQADSGKAGDAEGAPGASVLEGCVLCLMALDRLAPPPSPVAAAVLLRSDLTQCAPVQAAPLARRARLSPTGRPRGPPPRMPALLVA